MSDQDTKLAKRLKDHTEKLREFMDEMERLDRITPDQGADPFQMPYSTRPRPMGNTWKLTF